ncbi:AtpZ/AtpI family protein [Nakamurella endophytica]|uniref:AtpZ/AtpI family protein n=1 Tax=Nakamurella endophytica TaxID=1748367 RepID=A0A917TCR5_9ACTN|nr:AtpZ/AtpI family protein [Nakamurella endophytica]GGM18047.1 hypothetical protein GCM10011594_42650 [Nakamurella endophytica]
MKMRANVDSTSSGANEGWAVMTTLLSGFVLWGGIGWLLDRWFGTHFLTPVGLMVGMALGIYAVVARFGGLSGTSVPDGSRAPGRSSAVPVPVGDTVQPPPASTRRETQ